MGKFKDEHGKTRVGKLLKGFKDKGLPIADKVFDVAGDLTGIEALNKVSELIVTDKELSEAEKAISIKAVNADIEDLANARKLTSDIQSFQFASWMAKNIPYLIDCFILLIWGAMTIFILGKALKLVDTDNSSDFTVVLGIYAGVTGLATQIVAFHRGSSQGSRMKDFIKKGDFGKDVF